MTQGSHSVQVAVAASSLVVEAEADTAVVVEENIAAAAEAYSLEAVRHSEVASRSAGEGGSMLVEVAMYRRML